MHRTEIISRLREYIVTGYVNESNWSLREGWSDLESLLSQRDGEFASAAAWVCAIATEFVVLDHEDCDSIADDIEEMAAGFLGLTLDEWEYSIAGLPPQKALERIERLCLALAA